MTRRHRRLHDLLLDRALLQPNGVAVRFDRELEVTSEQLVAMSRIFASGVEAHGVRAGDRVVSFLDNCPEQLVTMFGTSLAGAIFVPFNTDLIGAMLQRMFDNTAPTVVITESKFLDAIGDMSRGSCTVVLTDADKVASAPDYVQSWDSLMAAGAGDALTHYDDDAPDRVAMILYTSGTTGESKGVMVTHEMACTWAESGQEVVGYTADDVTLTCLPLYHSNALFVTLLPALLAGATTVVTARFSASRFWQDVRRHHATITSVLGSMGPILMNLPPSEEDTIHRLRMVVMIPRGGGQGRTFEERFGVQTTELYGLTDFGIPIGVPAGVRHPTSCGRELSQWECRIVDARDNPVALGDVGELVLRPRRAWMTQAGYWNKPEATTAAWRNLWLHTGDQMRLDEDGWFYFVGRDKDMIRRAGENVSAFEVEQVLLAHPAVQDAAVFGVPSRMLGEEVMAVVVPREGQSLDWSELLTHCERGIAYFAVPRYYVKSDQLPRTESQKVKKSALLERYRADDAWDAGPRGRKARQLRTDQ